MSRSKAFGAHDDLQTANRTHAGQQHAFDGGGPKSPAHRVRHMQPPTYFPSRPSLSHPNTSNSCKHYASLLTKFCTCVLPAAPSSQDRRRGDSRAVGPSRCHSRCSSSSGSGCSRCGWPERGCGGRGGGGERRPGARVAQRAAAGGGAAGRAAGAAHGRARVGPGWGQGGARVGLPRGS